MKLTQVPTPIDVKFENEDRQTLEEIGKVLTHEFRVYKQWTANCTATLQRNPKCLFLYDRLEHALRIAYGADYKIALNPLMILCYHKDCLSSGRVPIRLKHIFKLDEYLLHLEDHIDEVGLSLQKRFGALSKNIFSTKEEMDKIAPAPFSINQDMELDGSCEETWLRAWTKSMESFGIERFPKSHGSNMTYICHWKDIMIKNDLIDSSSLTFQEDDALIFSMMQYPDPVPDWSVWQTIFLYALKFMSSCSAAALNLHRGITFNRATTKKEKLPEIFCEKQIMHPYLSTQHVECIPV